ncbi:hypothetical protein CYMTET_15018 [Cymbomonas tetramitiformis]|uniref:Uncharacterized protein n=1 Tax=Cymbomonas tetramitiformis TaxID=36881 RepID=A0AAE0GF42_9CHLO|nr:hypothetical protein CYMTET_15018 [Cymbomonas tetramitiformis]
MASYVEVQNVVGAVQRDQSRLQWGEPTPEEKERAMGFQTWATNAPGVTARERGEALGRAFDVRCVSRLMALCQSVNRATMRRLYSKGATPELVSLPPPCYPEARGQPPGDKTGLGAAELDDDIARAARDTPVQFVPARERDPASFACVDSADPDTLVCPLQLASARPSVTATDDTQPSWEPNLVLDFCAYLAQRFP